MSLQGKFQSVVDAYEILGNSKLRRNYDRGKLGKVTSVADRETFKHEVPEPKRYRDYKKSYFKLYSFVIKTDPRPVFFCARSA